MNKKAAGIIIAGIPITLILIFLIRLWVANEIYEAVEPELQKALMQLGDAVVCPPELKNSNFEICVNKDGDAIINGKVNELVTLELNSNQKKDSCIVHVGEYIDQKTCRFDNFDILQNFEMHYTYQATTMTLNSKNLEFYIFNNKELRIPIKKWSGFFRITRYIPK